MSRPRVWQQEIEVIGDVGYLRLSHPDGREITHLFSARHYDLVRSNSWSHNQKPYNRFGYAQCHPLTGSKHTVQLQNLVLGVVPSRTQSVDHLNQNSLDSRDENLRVVSRRKQMRNLSSQSDLGVGISLVRRSGKYQVTTIIDYATRLKFWPVFDTLEQATVCRDSYLELADEYDRGVISLPSPEQLRALADAARAL